MSKGGAGKVYFVLYLAVILELLIIIVERDEAEEHLVKKQKESLRIVESILAQLQTGGGTEGMNTRPQDEITLKDAGLDPEVARLIKDERVYNVDVGVVDVSGEIDKVKADQKMDKKAKEVRFKEFVDLANVRELKYQIFYNPGNDPQAPPFPSEDSMRALDKSGALKVPGASIGDGWRLEMVRQLRLDDKATKNQPGIALEDLYKDPVYGTYTDFAIGNIREFAPSNVAENEIFSYAKGKTDTLAMESNGKYKKRTFVVYYKPPQRPGWFKLRFASQTNLVLGVRSEEPAGKREVADDEKVNIGTVQLKVKDLKVVKKELAGQLEGMGVPPADDLIEGRTTLDKFKEQLELASTTARRSPEEKIREKASKIELYGYIAQLLAPNQSESFQGNANSMVYTLRVVKLPPRPSAPPQLFFARDTTFSFDKATTTEIAFEASPYSENASELPKFSITPNIAGRIVPQGVTQSATSAGGVASGKYKIVFNDAVGAGDYQVTVTHQNQRGEATSKSVPMIVFPSQLTQTSREELESTLDGVAFGDPLEFSVMPSSELKVPASQFRIAVKLGSNDQRADVKGLSVGGSDNMVVPAGADKVSVAIFWQSPTTGERVPLFGPAEGTPSQKKPSIVTSGITVSPITDPRDPVFVVQGIEIKAPRAGTEEEGRAEVTDVRIEIGDVKLKNSYQIQKVGELKRNGTRYEQAFKLKGRIPVRRGDVSGSAEIKIYAKARNSNGSLSKDQIKKYNIPNISY